MARRTRKTRKEVAQQLVAKPQTAGYKTPPIYSFGSVIRELPPFTFMTIRAMLWDPTIKLGLAMRAAPLCNAEFAYEDGTDDAGQIKYTPGVKAHRPEVAEFVEAQMKHIWKNYLRHLLRAQIWGWSAVECTGKVNQNGWIEIDELLPRHPAYTTALESNGRIAGVNFKGPSQQRGNVMLLTRESKCIWHAFMPEDGLHYGSSVLRGAYSPWADKWLDGCALDTRRLFHHKDAYGGVDLTYPAGTTAVERGGELVEIPNQDIAQQIAEQLRAGGVTTRPAMYDQNGNPMWELTRATIPASPTHIYEYPKDLDKEMLRGMETPDGVLTDGNTGSWDGKSIPAQAFYTGLDIWLKSLVGDVVKQHIEPLVMLNTGRAEDFEVCTKPLGLQAMEQIGANKGDSRVNGGSDEGFNPFLTSQEPAQRQQIGYNGQQQMSLRDRAKTEVVELLVGQGVFEAGKIVEQAREELDRRGVIRMATAHAPKGGVTLKGKKYVGGEFIPGHSQEEVDAAAAQQGGESAGKKKSGKAKQVAKDKSSATSKRTPEPKLTIKAQRAKDNHVLIDKDIQRYAEEYNEPRFAQAVGGVSFPDGEPIDVAVAGKNGVVAHGIELKTMVINSNNKITMKRDAMQRKAAWEKKNKAPVHTVVLDDSAVYNANGPGQHDETKRRIFYRRGYGSFRVGTMHEVTGGIAELKKLMAAQDTALPPAAQRPKGQSQGRLAA